MKRDPRSPPLHHRVLHAQHHHSHRRTLSASDDPIAVNVPLEQPRPLVASPHRDRRVPSRLLFDDGNHATTVLLHPPPENGEVSDDDAHGHRQADQSSPVRDRGGDSDDSQTASHDAISPEHPPRSRTPSRSEGAAPSPLAVPTGHLTIPARSGSRASNRSPLRNPSSGAPASPSHSLLSSRRDSPSDESSTDSSPSPLILRCHVLVVGAGPVGIAVAVGIRRLGHSVIVVEKRGDDPEWPSKSAPDYYASRLQQVGLGDDVLQILTEGLGIADINQCSCPDWPTGRIFVLGELQRRLRRHLLSMGGDILFNTEVVGVAASQEGLVATLRGAGAIGGSGRPVVAAGQSPPQAALSGERRVDVIPSMAVVVCDGKVDPDRARPTALVFGFDETVEMRGLDAVAAVCTVQWSAVARLRKKNCHAPVYKEAWPSTKALPGVSVAIREFGSNKEAYLAMGTAAGSPNGEALRRATPDQVLALAIEAFNANCPHRHTCLPPADQWEPARDPETGTPINSNGYLTLSTRNTLPEETTTLQISNRGRALDVVLVSRTNTIRFSHGVIIDVEGDARAYGNFFFGSGLQNGLRGVRDFLALYERYTRGEVTPEAFVAEKEERAQALRRDTLSKGWRVFLGHPPSMHADTPERAPTTPSLSSETK